MGLNEYIIFVGLLSAIITMIVGIVGIFALIIAQRLNQLRAILQYYETGDDFESVSRRDKVFTSNKEQISRAIQKYLNKENELRTVDENDPDYLLFVAMKDVCNFWHRWGLMVRKGYLPIWVFHGVSGKGAKKLYDKMEDFIKARKNIESPGYAVHYEWLVNTLIKRDEAENNGFLSKKRFYCNLFFERYRKLPIERLDD